MTKWTIALVSLAACGTPSNSTQDQPDAPVAHADAPESTSDAPPTTTGTDPANDGPNAVTTTTVSIPGATSGRTVPATIYVPTGVSSPALVVISPGFQLARTQYASYAHHLATWGFVAITTDYADQGFFADHQLMANDVGAVISYALGGTFTPAVDATKIALAGHSLGGDISVLAASGDARVKAVLGWDPVDGSSPSVVPEKMFTAALAVIGETTDSSGFMACAPSGDNFTQFYAAAASPALAMTITGADHMDWVDDQNCSVCGFCTAGSAAASLARTATKRLDVAWLRKTLFADTAMTPWLMAPPEVGAGTASIQHK